MGESGGLTGKEKSPKLERYRLIEPYLQGARTLSSIAAQAEVSLRTAQRWVDQYRRHGLEALGTKRRSDAGMRRVMSQKVVEMIEGLALEKPRVHITAIYRELTEFTERTGERLPSYQAVHRVVRAIPVSLMTLAHSGSRVYCERFDLVQRREAAKPNAIWQADHAQLKIRLLREDGTISRPWLTVVIDDHSRAIAGYYLAFDPPYVLRTAAYHAPLIKQSGMDYMPPSVIDMKAIMTPATAADSSTAHNALVLYRRQIDAAFKEIDLVIVPTTTSLPKPIKDSLKVEMSDRTPKKAYDFFGPTSGCDNTVAFDVYGVPALTLTCGFSKSGLPVGLMIAGPHFSEGKVLALAYAFQQATDWHKRKPVLTPETPVPREPLSFLPGSSCPASSDFSFPEL